VRRISCKAFLCWFGSACRLVSAEMFAAAFYPHVPRDLNQRRNATYSRSLTRITMPYCCHHWNRARHPYGYGPQGEGNLSLRQECRRSRSGSRLVQYGADAVANCANLSGSTLEKRP
jgi:hypothetical protein